MSNELRNSDGRRCTSKTLGSEYTDLFEPNDAQKNLSLELSTNSGAPSSEGYQNATISNEAESKAQGQIYRLLRVSDNQSTIGVNQVPAMPRKPLQQQPIASSTTMASTSGLVFNGVQSGPLASHNSQGLTPASSAAATDLHPSLIQPLRLANLRNSYVTIPKGSVIQNIGTPNLVRIGVKPTQAQPTHGPYRASAATNQRSLQPIQYQPEDTNTTARRLRVSLINQHRKVLNPSLKVFHSETDVVSNLVPYHVFESEPLPSPKQLQDDDLAYIAATENIASRYSDLLRKLHLKLYPPKKYVNLNEDITLARLFVKYEREKLNSDIRSNQQGNYSHSRCMNVNYVDTGDGTDNPKAL